MSHKNKNIYLQKARQKSLTGTSEAAQEAETKHDFKKTAIYTGRDILFGGIGGALAGALVGRSSLLLGIAVTGAGHFLGSPSTAMFGVGLMASGGYQAASGAMHGVEKDGMEGVKERFASFKDSLKHQLFLDKIIPSKKPANEKTETEETTNGLGDVQYFKHPGNEESDLSGNELDLSEANKIISQINASAESFAAKKKAEQNVSGTETEYMNGNENEYMNGSQEEEDRIL